MLEIVPVIFWVIAIVWTLVVCILCVMRGKLLTAGHPHVDTVSWQVIVAQMVSVVVAAVPYVIGKCAWDSFSTSMQNWYASVAWPAGIVLLILIVLELVLMYLQARRAMYTEMDDALNRTQSNA